MGVGLLALGDVAITAAAAAAATDVVVVVVVVEIDIGEDSDVGAVVKVVLTAVLLLVGTDCAGDGGGGGVLEGADKAPMEAAEVTEVAVIGGGGGSATGAGCFPVPTGSAVSDESLSCSPWVAGLLGTSGSLNDCCCCCCCDCRRATRPALPKRLGFTPSMNSACGGMDDVGVGADSDGNGDGLPATTAADADDDLIGRFPEFTLSSIETLLKLVLIACDELRTVSVLDRAFPNPTPFGLNNFP